MGNELASRNLSLDIRVEVLLLSRMLAHLIPHGPIAGLEGFIGIISMLQNDGQESLLRGNRKRKNTADTTPVSGDRIKLEL